MTDQQSVPHVLYEDLPMAADRGAGWAKLRSLGPVLQGDGWYYFTNRDDVLAALRSPEVFSSTRTFDQMVSEVPLIPLAFDPPEHTRYRRVLHPYFSPQALGAVLPSLQVQAADIITEIARRDECEVIADLATPYPSQVFLTLFGLPIEDRNRLIGWKDAIIDLGLERDPDKVDLVPAAQLFGYLTEAIETQRRVTTRPVTVAGVDLPEGSEIRLCLGAVNRDGSDAVSGDDLVMDGKLHKHWGFGGGPHRCLGSHLARMELRIVVSEWLKRIPEFTLAPGARPEIKWPAATCALPALPLLLRSRSTAKEDA